MARNKSAIKRTRQNIKKNEHNKNRRSRMRTLVKKVFTTSDKAQAETALKEAVSFIDRMSVKGVVHKNTAARKKAQLTKYVNNL
ncbi:MAG: 30S ribosomal protein S20 [Balneolaceae bacterium]|nr:30S ribosomal protein S20 [Balneolaceae bacterium]MBO6547584.1 30S ribosomal protein S20 [Balneolaceae bacterium]MBO6648095.1 30S ribosomal protein S20 [Balneolaceae bacterium]